MAKKLTTECFIEKARDVHGDKYDYSKSVYTNSRTKVVIVCPDHGEFEQVPNSHLSGRGCASCVEKVQPINTEEFIKKCLAVHGDNYDYSKVIHTGARNNITIICPEHGEFEQTASRHSNGRGCQACGGTSRSNSSKFIEKAKQIHGDKYDYSKVKYTTAKEKVTIICKIHGEFEQAPYNHLSGKGCLSCGDTTLTTPQFIEKANQVHGDNYDYSKVDYATAREKVTIICKIHGEFEQAATYHLNGSSCPECAIEDRKLTTSEFIEKANQVHGDKYDYSKVEYISAKEKVTIICPEHGKFSQTPDSHSRSCGCSKCTSRVSKSEQELIELIEDQYSGAVEVSVSPEFMDGKLELDIYLPDLKLAFEYNGIRWHSEYRKSDKHYHANKTKMCAAAGVRLVHIWEDDWRDNNEIERKFISNLLVEPDKVIYARKTKVMEIDQAQANSLLIAHHVQGSVNATRHIGLFIDGGLVAVGSFTHRPTGVELVRYVSSVPVIGGLGKVCKHHGGDIYTFCDLARFNGQSYVANGFVEKDQIGVDYKYVVSGKRVHKFNFRKKSILRKYPNVEPGTELEMTKSLNIHRIWDCGKVRYVYENK